MYTIIQLGSLQFKVSEGDTIEAYRMKAKEGDTVKLDQVLFLSNDSDVRIGQPYLKDVKVEAKVLKHCQDDKVVAFKYRKRKDSSSKVGHRQKRTALQITKISA